jgi:leucyl-tRNA synthetase
MIPEYNFKEIEEKWQKIWEETALYKVDLANNKNKLYCLVMFLYPSGDRLHIGHWYNYGPTDTWARFKRMQGYNVFEPMGYDAFGLPAENYAIKAGIHPAISTAQNIGYIKKQLKAMGTMYDWDAEINTSQPDYYKWTQWLFLQLYKHGLAYRKKASVNWCPQCKTVLANEQVIEGKCERCDSDVTTKDLEQWFFKITAYAEKLLEGHNRIHWPEKTITMQKNWIGRSVGASIRFKVDCFDEIIEVFTTRPDTIFGVTYMVLAPEHPLVKKLTLDDQKQAVEEYIEEARKKKEIDRLSAEREKTGVFTGSYCINPVNGDKIQIWIADYVIVSYGTGAVMAVPAHDQRDFEFAAKYSLEIREVISKSGTESATALEKAYEEPGIMIHSKQFDGLHSTVGKEKVIEFFKQNEFGEEKINFKLRDWLISRQRYWGAPIPIVYCENCGEVPVPEKELPVLLPEKVDFTGKGESPLLTAPDFVNTKCPQCGHAARREVDTMDTFVCSSWYFLRFPNAHLAEMAFDRRMADMWLPVDQYVGGAEHAVMHLLYARFFTKALHEFGLIAFDEPFTRLIHQGVITNKGAKMSKSRGNVVNPDQFVEKYGSDTFRMYMMFMGSYEEGGDWNDEGILGTHRFLKRIWRLVQQVTEAPPQGDDNNAINKVIKQMHFAIKHSTQDLERFHFNTAISRVMELVNEIYLYVQNISPKEQNKSQLMFAILNVIKLIAPFAPHLSEELWQQLQQKYSIFSTNWPEWDEQALAMETIMIGVQINGKIRTQIEISISAQEDEIINAAIHDEKVAGYLIGKKLQKSFVIPKKLVSLVVA